jgi:hypothetical protein
MLMKNSKPDPHGQVALLLCESLLHVLVEQRVISREAALSAIESVHELTEENAEATAAEIGSVSPTALIRRIVASFAAKD